MVEIDAEEMFQTINYYNSRVQRAVSNREWTRVQAARVDLDKWFADRGIKLTERQT